MMTTACGVILFLLAMVAVGRGMEGVSRPLFVKYTAIPMIWFWLLVAVSTGEWWRILSRSVCGRSFVIVAIVLYIFAQIGIDHASGRPEQESFMGRASAIRHAHDRSARYRAGDDFLETLHEKDPWAW